MKCQKCGNNEVNFHYSSNVNGSVTEAHLCSGCAMESGYDISKMFDLDFGNIFDNMLPIRNAISGFIPMAIPMINANSMFPFTMMPRRGMIEQGQRSSDCECSACGQSVLRNPNVEVDEIMSQRRQLNAQMQEAVAKEEFEKAAELRDKIRALESAGAQQSGSQQEAERTEKCDSETTSQDSPGAQ